MITIETINGREYTVIRKPFNAEWVREQLAIGNAVTCSYRGKPSRTLVVYNEWMDGLNHSQWKVIGGTRDLGTDELEYVRVILPPLPRRPKPSDAPLLHLYLSMGIIPVFGEERLDCGIVKTYCNGANHITHALHNGERVDVAITDGEE